MRQHFPRKSVSLVALAVAVGFIEVAVSVACPAVPAEALVSPTSLEESIRKGVRSRAGQQFLVRLGQQLSGSPDVAVSHLSPDHPCILAVRAVVLAATGVQASTSEPVAMAIRLAQAGPVSLRAPPSTLLS